jgi:tetratricopeptide (TPR) repeat protein
VDSAKICFQKAIDFNYKYTFGYFYLASLEVQNNNPSAAISYLLKFDEYGGQPAQGYDLAIQTSQQLKNQLYELYFTAKKLAITGKSNEAYNLIGQVLTIDPNFEPAKKLKKSFDDAMKAQQIKEENRKNGIQ